MCSIPFRYLNIYSVALLPSWRTNHSPDPVPDSPLPLLISQSGEDSPSLAFSARGELLPEFTTSFNPATGLALGDVAVNNMDGADSPQEIKV